MGERSYLIVATSSATPEQVFDLLADAPRWREWAGSSIRESGWVTGTTAGVGAVRMRSVRGGLRRPAACGAG
jgi:hypothetical protein